MKIYIERLATGVALVLAGLWGGAALGHLTGVRSDFLFAAYMTGLLFIVAGGAFIIWSFPE